MGLETIIISVVVPIVVELIKHFIPALKGVGVPTAAIGVGAGLGIGAEAISFPVVDPNASSAALGAVMGLTGVGVRELVVQAKHAIQHKTEDQPKK